MDGLMVTALDLIAEGYHPDRVDQIARIENGGDGCIPAPDAAEPAPDAPVVGADELAELDDLDADLP